MRQSNINELLSFVNDLLAEFESIKEKAKNDASIKEIFKPKVKSSIESLRSCLDYLAIDNYEFIKTQNPKIRKIKRIYFPYGKNDEIFNCSIERNLPDLKKCNENLFNFLYSIQSFNSENDWLITICELSNELKHDNLKDQRLERYKEVDLFGGLINVKGLNINAYGNSFNGKLQSKAVIIKDGILISKIDGTEKDIKITDWTNFYFENTEVNIIKLIKIAYIEITKLSNKVYKVINSNN